METISHNGSTFVKATALAKKYRYTTDYVGQLCRQGKVEAKLVGRAWFVNENTLVKHKEERYASFRQDDLVVPKSLISKAVSSNREDRYEVHPRLSKKTHRHVVLNSSRSVNTPGIVHSSKSPRVHISYLPDDHDLVPKTLDKIRLVSSEINKVKVSFEQNNHDTDKSAIESVIPQKLEVKVSNRVRYEKTPVNRHISRVNLPIVDSFNNHDIEHSQGIAPSSAVRIVKRYEPVSRVVPTKRSDSQSSVENKKSYQSHSEDLVEEVYFSPKSVTSLAPNLKSLPSNPPRSLTVFVFVVFLSLAGFVLLTGLSATIQKQGDAYSQSLDFSFSRSLENFIKIIPSL